MITVTEMYKALRAVYDHAEQEVLGLEYAALRDASTTTHVEKARKNLRMAKRALAQYERETGSGTAAFKRYGTLLRIYDNGGKTADRYTIMPPKNANEYRTETNSDGRPAGQMFQCICASAYPFHPQGFGQWSEAMPGPHLGKRVRWQDLPEDVQRYAKQSFPTLTVGL